MSPRHDPLLVLIADDNGDIADSLSAMIGLLGVRTLTVSNGLEAVEVSAQQHPEIAILDVDMPVLNGCEAAKIIRKSHWKPLLIIAHTAFQRESEPLASGADNFDLVLQKPISFEELISIIQDYQNNRQ